jgi:hypothetical protein
MQTETGAAEAVTPEDYRDLSARHAADGDARRAALAAWAADLCRAVTAMTDLGVAPEHQQRRLGDAAAAVESVLVGELATERVSVREIVAGAREALLRSLNPGLAAALEPVLDDLGHLDEVDPPAPGLANEAVLQRLGGRGGEELVGDLLGAAADCRAVAHVMGELGDAEEQRRQDVNAHLAGFEAYLVLSSAASGDATLATTDLRWDLAAQRIAANGDTPQDSASVRAAMAAVLAPAERPALDAVLDLGTPG